MNFSEFTGYSAEFDKLPEAIKSNLVGIIFSVRDSTLSVAAGTKDKNTFEQLCSGFKLPQEVFEGEIVKWGVDLESINSNTIRVYVSFSKRSSIRIIGFYLDRGGKILGKKLYKSNTPTTLLIDRFDSEENQIGENEVESVCTESEWTGPKELVSIVKKAGYAHNFLKKESKNQTYLVIHRKEFYQE